MLNQSNYYVKEERKFFFYFKEVEEMLYDIDITLEGVYQKKRKPASKINTCLLCLVMGKCEIDKICN